MLTRSRRLRLFMVPSFVLLASSLSAQVPKETLPSFKADQVFDGGDIDHVNVYSGDVQLTVPLGPEYSLGSGITWRLTANYSNRYWNLYRENCGTPVEPCYLQPAIRHGVLSGRSSLGAGWRLELGYITGSVQPDPYDFARPRYHAPDGSVHALVDKGNGLWEPEDSMHARFHRVTSPSEKWSMEVPDGSRWWFENQVSPPTSPNGWDFSDGPYASAAERKQFLLTRIEDRYNDQRNLLEVGYRSDVLWQIDHIDMGTRRINFTWDSFVTEAADPEPSRTWPVLKSITFPVAHSQSLLVTFGRTDKWLERTSFESGPPQGCSLSMAPIAFRAPFLSSITVGSQVYGFWYGLGASGYRGLVLQSLDLPTGGRIEYEYGGDLSASPCLHGPLGCPSVEDFSFSANRPATRQFADPDCSFDVFQSFIDSIPSVWRRRENDRVTGVIGYTQYDRSSFYEPTSSGSNDPDMARVVRLVVVERPNGNGGRNATKHFFTVNVQGGPTGAELERRMFEGTNVGASATPLRSVVFCYDASAPYEMPCGVTEAAQGVSTTAEKIPNLSGSSPERPRREVTWYGKNPLHGGLCSDVTAVDVACWARKNEGWDTSAHEFVEQSTEIPRSGPSLVFFQGGMYGRKTTTTWTPVESPRWLPKLYNSRTVADLYDAGAPTREPSVITTTFDFDTANGKFRSTSVSDSGSSLTHQLLYGNPEGPDPVLERHIGTGAISGTYETTRTFQNGLVLSARRTLPQDLGWYQFRVTRDSSTDTVTTSSDPNGLATTYTWDPQGRLTSIQPTGDAQTTICYGSWSASAPTAPPYALVLRGISAGCPASRSFSPGIPAEGSGTVEAWAYDGFGRVIREIRLLPTATNGTYLAVRVTTRNDAGLVTSTSEWTPCGSGSDPFTCFSSTSGSLTTFSGFDFLGRAHYLTKPDQILVEKWYDDYDYASMRPIPGSDTRESTITHGVSSGTTWEAVRRDIFGRVIAAAEPANSEPYGPHSFAEWNVLDKVCLYTSDRTFAQGSVTQNRSWAYNRFGFLTGSSDPETGQTTYSNFDALGNAWLRTGGGIAVSSDFDALGRLLRTSSGGIDFARSYYDGLEGGSARTDAYLGKLTKKIGYNPGSFENARVEDVLFYAGLGGRLSSRQTALYRSGATTPFTTLEQVQTWNGLGLPASRSLSGPGASMSTNSFYTAGALTRITSGGQTLASGISYHPFGGLASYTTGNGVVTTVSADPNRLPRPSRIQTSGASTNFDTGTISYDGSGNVISMGPVGGATDTFEYDRLSRLKVANWRTVSSAHKESFFYDGVNEEGFGNLARITGQGSGMPAQVLLDANAANNRLVNGIYDARGNLTSFSDGSTVTDAFAYDALSRRTSVTRLGALVSWHLYDGNNERVARVLPGTQVSSSGLLFYSVTPCRLLDTRGATGPYGGPYLTGGQAREFSAPAGPCGIAANAVSIVGNLTTAPRGDVGQVSGTHSFGFLKLYPADVAPTAAAAAVVNPTKIRAELAFGKLASGGSFRLLADIPATETVDAILDISGYFAPSAGSTSPRTWLLTQRDEANRPVADWKWLEGSSSASAQSFSVYLGSNKVASRELSPTPQWYFYASDHLGTPRLTTGEKPAGASTAPVVSSTRFRAFGERFEALAQSERPGFEFAMMERDSVLPDGATSSSGSGNHYDHARFFADKFARFLSPDQLSGRPEDPTSWNRYTYARNNPLKYVDLDGREDDLAWDAMSRETIRQAYGDEAVARYEQQRLVIGGVIIGGLFLGSQAPALLSWFLTPQGNEQAQMLTEGLVGPPGPSQMPVAGSIRSVNPQRGLTNCANCAVATDALLAGRPASALTGGPVRISVLEKLFNGTFQKLGSREAVEAVVHAGGNGTRGIVYMGEPGKLGHVFNVVNQDGVVRFLDGQTGKAAVFWPTWSDVRYLQTK